MAGEKYVVLTSEEWRLLKQVMDWVRKQPQNRPDDEQTPVLGQSMETYIAIATSGIPALNKMGTGTFSDDVPGSGYVQVYQIASGPVMSPVAGFNPLVYNMSSSAVASGDWIIITRDAFGNFLVVFENCGP